MKELYIIRHGLAVARTADESIDFSRPLTRKGTRKMKKVARGLRELGVAFDELLTSPLIRSRQTAAVVKRLCADKKGIYESDLLRPGSSHGELALFLNGLAGDRVAIVGHEPFLSEFAAYCLAGSGADFVDLKKGGVMMLEVDGAIQSGHCLLAWLMKPSQLASLA